MLIPGAANSSSFSHEDNETNTHTHIVSQSSPHCLLKDILKPLSGCHMCPFQISLRTRLPLSFQV